MKTHQLFEVMFRKSDSFHCSSYVLCKMDTLYSAIIKLLICSLSMCFLLQKACDVLFEVPLLAYQRYLC